MKGYKVVFTYYDWDVDLLMDKVVAEGLTEEEATTKAEEVRKTIMVKEMGEDVEVLPM